MHARLDVDVDADVLVGERGDRDADRAADRRSGVEGGRRDRNPVADANRRLLALGHAQLRLGDHLGVGVGLQEVHHHPGDRPEQPGAGLVQDAEVVERHRRAAAVGHLDRLAGPAAGPEQVDAEGLQERAVDLQELDVDDQLRLRLVVRLDDLLRHLHAVGRVADGDRVEPVVLRQLARVQERPQQHLHVLDVGVAQIERLHDQVVVLLVLLLVVVGDQDGVLVPDLEEVLVHGHQGVEGLLERHVGKIDGGLLVEVEPVVVDEVDPGGLAQGVVDLLDGLVLRRRVQVRRHPAGRLRFRLFLELLHLRLVQLLLALPFRQRLGQLVGGVLVRRVEVDRLLELGDGGVDAARLDVRLPLGEVILRRPHLGARQGDLVARAGRIGGDRLGEQQHRPVVILRRHLFLTGAVQMPRGAGAERQRRGERGGDPGVSGAKRPAAGFLRGCCCPHLVTPSQYELLALEPGIRVTEFDRLVADLEDLELAADLLPRAHENQIVAVVQDGDLILGRADVADELVVDWRRLRLGRRRGRQVGLRLRGRLGLRGSRRLRLLGQRFLALAFLLRRQPRLLDRFLLLRRERGRRRHRNGAVGEDVPAVGIVRRPRRRHRGPVHRVDLRDLEVDTRHRTTRRRPGAHGPAAAGEVLPDHHGDGDQQRAQHQLLLAFLQHAHGVSAASFRPAPAAARRRPAGRGTRWRS